MSRAIQVTFFIVFLAFAQTACLLQAVTGRGEGKPDPVVPPEGYRTLAAFPFKEAWYGMYFQEDKVGYSHFKIEPDGKDFKIVSESMLRLTTQKKTDEIRMKEKVKVRPDLGLISFQSLVRMNDKDLRMTGRVEGGNFLVDMKTGDEKMVREYPVQGDIYHSGAISLMPALKGLKEGGNQTFLVFNPEKQGMEKVEQQMSRVVGGPGPNAAVWKIRNQYGRSVVHSWLDAKGLTVVEKALNGALITMLEDEKAAKAFIAERAPGKDLELD